jgi:serine/threonine-protein kinase RsbW
MEEKIVIINNVEELPVLAEKIEEIGDKWNWPVHFTMNINLALEEAVSNIIFYAFDDKENHNIDVSVKMVNAKVTIEIEDEGIFFDPTSRKEPDITLPVQERPIGGLGIFLILKIMDTVRYKREKNKNILTLIKKVSNEPS